MIPRRYMYLQAWKTFFKALFGYSIWYAKSVKRLESDKFVFVIFIFWYLHNTVF